ncbi:hypothetical protein ACFL4G_07865 [Thermodesulfobacteriota bacterium]
MFALAATLLPFVVEAPCAEPRQPAGSHRELLNWPINLSSTHSPILQSRQELWPKLRSQFERAGQWLASFPIEELRFDASIGLFMIRRNIDSSAFLTAYRIAREVADRDHDHPMHKIWNPAFVTPADTTSAWTIPHAGQRRVNVNRVVIEALHCRENGIRQETLQYLAGPMRDDGGYHTTHSLWALVLAHERGCIPDSEYEQTSRELQDELEKAQPAEFSPKSTLDIDLYAERMLVILLSGCQAGKVTTWAHRLLALQDADGSWFVAADSEPHYYRYHATMTATWALSEWIRRELVSCTAAASEPH